MIVFPLSIPFFIIDMPLPSLSPSAAVSRTRISGASCEIWRKWHARVRIYSRTSPNETLRHTGEATFGLRLLALRLRPHGR